MTHIFKPGDRAYCLHKNTWIELENNPDEDSDSAYPLASEGGKMLFTRDGRPHWSDKWAALLPINPYDLADPSNPPEFRYPFMLNGRPVKIGDRLIRKLTNEEIIVQSLVLDYIGPAIIWSTRVGDWTLHSEYFCWPDELPVKKKVAKWAFIAVGKNDNFVGFTEEMTEEEARKLYGSKVQMIPGTEREVEGCKS